MIRYPFAALVGQEQLKTALLLNAIDPSLGGVLICGEKGTAKSTAARALVDLLPSIRVRHGCRFHSAPDDSWHFQGTGCDLTSGEGDPEATDEIPIPFVELPLGATEDRVVGTLDLAVALRERRQAFHPGLLASANRGILYVDEINLLADHLVDLLLDAAASGINVVQREGLEVVHPSRFLIIGTMNPEEGQLRPQLLDRFGLMVDVAAPRDPKIRVEVVRRRMAFEADPAAFVGSWHAEQNVLRSQIAAATDRIATVMIADETLDLISQICCEMQVDGMRADIAMYKAGRALAALHGHDEVTVHDIREAAELVLPHRRRRQPFEKPGLDRQQLDDVLPPSSNSRQSANHRESNGDLQPETAGADRRMENDQPKPDVEPQDSLYAPAGLPTPHDRRMENDQTKPDVEPRIFPTSLFAAGPNVAVPPIKVISSQAGMAKTSGRRNPTAYSPSGHFVRSVADPEPISLAVGATLRSASLNEWDETGSLSIQRENLHSKVRSGETGTLILLLVDASGSMAARRRMEAVKGAALSLLVDAYQRRDRVGVIAFRGPQAELVLPPTNSLDLARDALEQLPTGGRTPLAHALMIGVETVRRERHQAPGILVLCVILTDGKANVALPAADGQPWEQAVAAAGRLAEQNVASLVLDIDHEFVRVGRARELAIALRGEYRPIEDLSADSLALEIRQHCHAQIPLSRTPRTSS